MNNAKEQNALLSHFQIIQLMQSRFCIVCLYHCLMKKVIKFPFFSRRKQHKNSSLKHISSSYLHNYLTPSVFFSPTTCNADEPIRHPSPTEDVLNQVVVNQISALPCTASNGDSGGDGEVRASLSPERVCR